jgi:hypothetical protein
LWLISSSPPARALGRRGEDRPPPERRVAVGRRTAIGRLVEAAYCQPQKRFRFLAMCSSR